jgi:hypothetical protein
MFCPQCQAEYRQGFTVCADCDVDLVHALVTGSTQPSSSPTHGNATFCPIWRGINQNTCVEICLELKAAGIYYEVTQTVRSRIGMVVEFAYELAVAGDDVKQAKELLGLPEALVEDLDLPMDPAKDEALPAPPQENFIDSHVAFRRRAPATPWYPEDAVVQICKQPAHDKDAILEMSLREHGIRTRAEQLPNGEWAFFVSPEDEPAAREILRQVVEGTPPD